ncbi:uncharacterized protein METZ01_LOCUS416614, partial [marine metagenome]
MVNMCRNFAVGCCLTAAGTPLIKYCHPSREITFSFNIDVHGYKLKKVRMSHRQNRTGVMQRRLPDTNKIF